MPAPSIPTLYDFESNFESAAAAWFTNTNASWQVLTPATIANADLETDFIRTPRVMVKFAITGTGLQKELVGGVEYYADRTGLMTLQFAVQRNNPDQGFGLMRGTVRQAMLERTQIFNANSLPYYQVVDVTEGSSTQSIDKENDEILTEMTFPLTFFVPPTSFP